MVKSYFSNNSVLRPQVVHAIHNRKILFYQHFPSSLLDFFHFCLWQALDVAQSLACSHLDPLHCADTHWLHLFDVCHILWSKEGEGQRDAHIDNWLFIWWDAVDLRFKHPSNCMSNVVRLFSSLWGYKELFVSMYSIFQVCCLLTIPCFCRRSMSWKKDSC